MRRLCLFVHTPVTPSLGVGVHSVNTELFNTHSLALDEELFPLLLEAKPCVILASIADTDSSNFVYNLMREFKEFRIANGSAARDPGLRIVIVSEGQIPRLNWASLGIYELIIGPVQSNVLNYKLNRHYHKAIDAGELEPETPTPPRLVKDVEMKPESTGEAWKVFTSEPVDKIQNRIFKKDANEEKVISLRLAIPGLNPKAGEWKKSKIQMDPPPQWNWEYTQANENGPTQYSFRGEEPVYHAEDGTWQFVSTVPKLLSYPKNSDTPVVQFEYVPKNNETEEAKLKVKSELQLKSIRSQTYDKKNPESDPLIIDDEDEMLAEDLDAAAADLEKAIARKKQNYGDLPEDRDTYEENSQHPKNRNREHSENLSTQNPVPKTHEAIHPNDGQHPKEKNELERAPHDAKRRAHQHSGQANPNFPSDFDLETENLSAKENARRDSKETLASGPAQNSKRENRGDANASLRKTSDRDPSFQETSSPLEKLRTHSDEKESASPSPSSSPSSSSRTEENSHSTADAFNSSASHSSMRADDGFSAAPHKISAGKTQKNVSTSTPNPKDGEIGVSGIRKSNTDSKNLSEAAKKIDVVKNDSAGSIKIKKEAQSGSMSVLYDDDSKKKANSKVNDATDVTLFDEHIWKFRLLKKGTPTENASLTDNEPRKLSLAPQQKLSSEEKRSMIDRILRFIVEFFTRKSEP